MEQEKNKVPSQENENPGLEKFQRAQELYERYFISNEEADFEEMITVLDSIYKNRVKSELREKGCCDKEYNEEAMQEAGRCLRCDHFGYGIFKGGRVEKW